MEPEDKSSGAEKHLNDQKAKSPTPSSRRYTDPSPLHGQNANENIGP